MTGRVFSIEEFSLYDGPGIRTTVFLKGCPLRCNWCHNPEGQTFEARWLRSPNGCLHCDKCLDAGERACGKRELTRESAAVCPRRLVRLCGEDYTPQALVASLEPNLPLLNDAGGGVTFSGGEVLSQAPFAEECLRLLRGKTHRALQTSGYGDETAFRALLNEAELVLYDLKLMDEEAFRYHIGASNEPILRNFRVLARSGVPYTVRVPLIPGVTDTEANLSAVAAFMRENGADYAELLPYNPMAGAKYALAQREYQPKFDPAVPCQARREIFDRYGIRTKVM